MHNAVLLEFHVITLWKQDSIQMSPSKKCAINNVDPLIKWLGERRSNQIEGLIFAMMIVLAFPPRES